MRIALAILEPSLSLSFMQICYTINFLITGKTQMQKNWKLQIGTFLVVLAAASSAMATTIINFTGTVNDGANAGNKVSGYVSYQLRGLAHWSDGSTFNLGYQDYFSNGGPLPISGHASDGVQTIKIGGLAKFDGVNIDVYKNAGPDHVDNFMTIVGGYDGVNWTEIELETYAFTDGVNASGIFSNTDYNNVDLSLGQHVNWFAPNTRSVGFLLSGGEVEMFMIDSISMSEVPEPTTLALLGLGIASFGVARRRRKAQ